MITYFNCLIPSPMAHMLMKWTLHSVGASGGGETHIDQDEKDQDDIDQDDIGH